MILHFHITAPALPGDVVFHWNIEYFFALPVLHVHAPHQKSGEGNIVCPQGGVDHGLHFVDRSPVFLVEVPGGSRFVLQIFQFKGLNDVLGGRRFYENLNLRMIIGRADRHQ